ncbi:TIGR00730 family Rossman fold protein [Nonomuraea sp. MTCD27]|uniref:LOG family protein n=1 Tax=Nonomuraea sp. MTCD27 TaxID=1676747 RepID=UPI0035C10CD4
MTMHDSGTGVLEKAPETARTLSVCVFCGARPGVSAQAVEDARRVGALLAESGHRLVYGVGGIGLMGALARAAEDGGAEIVGVIPQFLYERERPNNPPAQTLIITDDLFERKREMIARADAFLALPGGFGTLDEITEVIAAAHLGVHDKPLIILDVDGIWGDFLRMVTAIREHGFAPPRDRPLFHLAGTPEKAMALLAEHTVVSGGHALG